MLKVIQSCSIVGQILQLEKTLVELTVEGWKENNM